MRFRIMEKTQSLYLIFVSGFCFFALGSSDFHLVQFSRSYEEAKTYCREMYTDLATVGSFTDMNELISLASNRSIARSWIGLEIGDGRKWHWSLPGQELDFLNWKAGNPQNNDQDACAAMNEDGEWFESECRTKRAFVCHNNNGTGGYVFVADTKSWRDAQDHCRNLSSDLVSIRSAEKNEAVRNVSGSQSLWIGLFKDPWRWSDGSSTSFRYWRKSQPNYHQNQDCVAAIFLYQGKWNDLPCTGKRRFFCQGAMKHTSTTSPTSTQDPLTTHVTTPPNNSTESVILTVHFTVAGSTSSSNATAGPTSEATAVSESTTPMATELVASTSTAEINNATTETLATTTTTPMETSAQPTETGPSLNSGNLILIQENMTWIQAMTYCREHYIDLVHISTQDVQERVAEMAKNATSPHVWIGLRYTCNFNFWFWASSTSGCYLNWAPGQGSDRKYDCGATGAVEATGRQQWVGLSETEKLNFICTACAG